MTLSYYTVEFTYESKKYVLEGNSVSLSTILEAVGLSGTITGAESSNTDSFTVEKGEEADDWTVTVKEAFEAEKLTVTLDETKYVIDVKADEAGTGGFTVTGGTSGTDYSYADSVLTILTDTALEISNTDLDTATTDRILVASGVNARITLAGVNINPSGGAALEIAENSTGNVSVILKEDTTNTLKGASGAAGLQKNGDENTGTLTIDGDGTLIAAGGTAAAGIGGGNGGKSACNIVINGGTIKATPGGIANTLHVVGAAIGTGGCSWMNSKAGSAKNITINGGTIEVTGNSDRSTFYGGVGIGCGYYGVAENIQITGGKVTAYSRYCGAAIGGGGYATVNNISISGGQVIAYGNQRGAAIGGGNCAKVDNISITGGEVTAIGGEKERNVAAAPIIGSSDSATDGAYCGTITIGKASLHTVLSGGNTRLFGTRTSTVTPVDEDGNNVYSWIQDTDNTNTLTVDGVPYPSSHIGEGKVYLWLDGKDHTLVNGTSTTEIVFDSDAQLFTLKGAAKYAGDFDITTEVGDGYSYKASENMLYVTKDGDYTISNKTDVSSTSERICVSDGVNANITLAGVSISASGNNKAAFSIADGSAGNVTVILKKDTENILKSGYYAAGIQKNGTGDTVGTLTIRGDGSLTVTGGTEGAGIGSASNKRTENIVIESGTITAQGGNNAAGIGAGSNFSAKNITIKGGIVTATGGDRGAGIGGGQWGSGDYISIKGGVVTVTGGKAAAGIGGGYNTDSSTGDVIDGGSVKVTAGSGAHAIGGGQTETGSSNATTPVNANGEEVYSLVFDTNGASSLMIDEKTYSEKHDSESKVYAWLTGKNHIVKTDDLETQYVFDTESKTFKIQLYKKDFSITLPKDAYAGETNIPEITARFANASFSLSYYKEGEENALEGAPTACGTYTVKINVTADDNYIKTTIDAGSYEIKKGDSAPKVTDTFKKEKEYNGKAFALSTTKDTDVTWTGDGTAAITYYTDKDCTIITTKSNSGATVAGAAPVNVGTYYAKVGIAENDNYLAGEVVVPITITKKVLTPSITGTASKTYDGTTSVESGDLFIALSGAADGEKPSATAASYVYVSASVGAGITVTATGIALDGSGDGASGIDWTKNYQLSTDTATIATGTILALDLSSIDVTMLLTEQLKEYATASSAYYTGKAITPTVGGGADGTSDEIQISWKHTVDGTLTATELISGTDYTIAGISNNINLTTDTSKAQLTIEGLGNFTGTKTFSFDIVNKNITAAATTYVDDTALSDSAWTNRVVTVKAPDGYLISVNANGDSAKESFEVSEESVSASGTEITYYLAEKITDSATGSVSSGAVSAAKTVTVRIDKTAPTGTIQISAKAWDTFLSIITFGRYKVSDQTVTISADDKTSTKDAKGSGISSVQYVIANETLALDDLKAIGTEDDSSAYTWQTYSSSNKPKVAEKINQVVYAKLADNAGNVTYVSSEGIIVDNTAPAISNLQIPESDLLDNSLTVSFDVDESCSYYLIAILNNSENQNWTVMSEEVKSYATDTNNSKVIARKTGAVTVAGAAESVEAALTGLTANTDYKIYVVAEDTVTDLNTGEETHNLSQNPMTVTATTTKTQPQFASLPTIIGTYGTSLANMTVSQVKGTAKDASGKEAEIEGMWSVAATQELTAGSTGSTETGSSSGNAYKEQASAIYPEVNGTTAYTVIFTPTGTDADRYATVTKTVIPSVTAKGIAGAVSNEVAQMEDKDLAAAMKLIIAGDAGTAETVERTTANTAGLVYTYDGNVKKPNVTLSITADAEENVQLTKALTLGTDYTVSYTGNQNAGTASLTIKGIGNYTGNLTRTYVIQKATTVLAFASDYSPSKTYDGKAIANPTASDITVTGATYEEIAFTWMSDSGETVTNPLNAGTYRLVASVPESANHTAAEKIIPSLVISKASIGTISMEQTYAIGTSGSKTIALSVPEDAGMIDCANAKIAVADSQSSTGDAENLDGTPTINGKELTFTVKELEELPASGSEATITISGISSTNYQDMTVKLAIHRSMTKVAAPTISPNGGTFTGSQRVTIVCATDGATIYYTTDGSIPAANGASAAAGTGSKVYTEAITITGTTTIRAIAVLSGCEESSVTGATFTLKPANDVTDTGEEGGSDSEKNSGSGSGSDNNSGSSTDSNNNSGSSAGKGSANQTSSTGASIGTADTGAIAGNSDGMTDNTVKNSNSSANIVTAASDTASAGNAQLAATENPASNLFVPKDVTYGKTRPAENVPFIRPESIGEGKVTISAWDHILDQAKEAKAGDILVVDMNGATTVPANVLDSIAGKNVTLVLDMGSGITWSINGTSFTAKGKDLSDIDFSVTTGADAGRTIPIDVINNVTGERYSINITLAYDGEFGFTAVLTINMDRKNADLYANLFYYNAESEELEFMNADRIDVDGNAQLSFTHASDYTIVIDDAPMDGSLEEAASEQSGEGIENETDSVVTTATNESESKGGVKTLAILIAAAVLVLVGLWGLFLDKKKKESEE